MANIKRLKKEVKQITQDLVNECLTYQHFHPDVKPEKVNSVLRDIINKSSDIIYKINHIKSKKDVNPKKNYRDIIKEINEKLIPVLDKLGGKD
jgi:molecular chaperone GrpE (heat shock protein)